MNPAGELNESCLLTEDAVAEQLSCSVALVRKWRSLGDGPKVVRIGRLVRYQRADLVAFIEAKKERAVAKDERADIEGEKERAA